jgi:ParB family chromosome partitioning protein
MHKKALGKGLEALLPEPGVTSTVPASEVREISLDQVAPNRYQPRRSFSDTELAELAESVKQTGVLQPVLVRRRGDGSYELIAGERRWRAAKLAGLVSLPAIVRNVSDEQAMVYALVENLQRQDLNPIESARAYQRLMNEFGLTQEDVAHHVGKDRSSVANSLRLLNLPNDIQHLVESSMLSTGHAKVLLGLTRPESQLRLARRIVEGQWSVRQAEREVAREARSPRARRAPHPRSPYADLEERLQRHFGTRVEITKARRGGKIVLHYADSEELDRLLQTLIG